jgi:hypothetical protein
VVASAGKNAIFGEKIPSRTNQIESSDWPLVRDIRTRLCSP